MITYHQLTNAQPVSEQWLLQKNCLLVLLLSMTLCEVEYLSGQFGLAVPTSCPSPVYFLCEQSE